MKCIRILFVSSLFLVVFSTHAQQRPDTQMLEGRWKLDMSPENNSDSNFAQMIITSVSDGTLSGSFYRDGVAIREGRINTQTGTIHAALVSGDGTGQYNTAFYFKDGKLYGTTHAIGRDFLAVWTATKIGANE
jgi:hypothetical protein